LKAVDADEGNEQVLVGPGSGEPGTGVLDVAWSPDGEWLAYSREDREELVKEAEDGRLPERYASLWRIRSDGRDASDLLNAGTPSGYGLLVAGWSPDGQDVLYWTDPMFSGPAWPMAPLSCRASAGGPRTGRAVLLHPDFPSGPLSKGDRIGWPQSQLPRIGEQALHVFSVSTAR
jgi:dipeptidyl aminopeptidase/acylaminoacyl peptidase